MFTGFYLFQTIMLGIQPLFFGMGTFGQMEVQPVSPLELTISYLEVSTHLKIVKLDHFPKGET